ALFLFAPYINGMIFDHLPEYLLGAIVLFCFLAFLHWFLLASPERPPGVTAHLVLGALLGLAFLAKQTAALFLVPILGGLAQRFYTYPKERLLILLSLLACVAVASLWYLPNFSTFWFYSVHHVVTDDYRVPVPILLYHLFWSAFTPLYFVLFALAVTFAAIAWRTFDDHARRALLMVGGGIFIPFVALILVSTNRQPRFLFPIIPLCVLFMGIVATQLALRLAGHARTLASGAVASLALINLAYFGMGLREVVRGMPTNRLSGVPLSYNFNGGYMTLTAAVP